MRKFLAVIFVLFGISLHAQGPNNARMLTGVNAQTGTSYQFVPADATRVTTFNNPLPVAATLPNGAALGFGPGTEFTVVNLGAGIVTITCSSCLIYSNTSPTGGPTLALSQGQAVELYGGAASPAIHYVAAAPSASSGAQTNVSNTFTVPQIFGADTIFGGPNPTVDVRSRGARPVNPNVIPGNTTCSISLNSNLATCGSVANLIVGDGYSIAGAGPAIPGTMTMPSAPTVTASCAGSLTGLGFTTPDNTGSTAYQYQTALRDIGGGETAASAAGTTATGAAALGNAANNGNQMTITSIAAGASNTFTATVNTTANVVAGCAVVIKGTTDDKEFGGVKIIASIVDGTHFTYTSGVDASRGISTTTATGGVADYWLCNHVALGTPGTGGYEFEIFGRVSGSMAKIAWSLPASLGFTDAQYNTWDDFGSPMMDHLINSWWEPLTPPASATNDLLTTTILAINGNVLTLNATAGATVASSPARFDNGPNIVAADVASNTFSAGGGGSIRFPSILESVSANSCYVISSYTVITGSVTQDAPICVSDTIDYRGSSWQGTRLDSTRLFIPSFGLSANITILNQGAYPMMWVKGRVPSNVFFQVAGNAGLGIFNTQSNEMVIDNLVMSDTGNPNSYMTILFYDYHDKSSSGFGYDCRGCSFISGIQGDGRALTPAVVSKFNTLLRYHYVTSSIQGFAYVGAVAGFSGEFDMGAEAQGPSMPIYTFIQPTGGTVGGYYHIKDAVNDTGAYAIIANLSPSIGFIGAAITVEGGNLPSSNQAAVTGSPFTGSITYIGGAMNQGQLSQFGQNTHFCRIGGGNGAGMSCSDYNINDNLAFSNFIPTVTGFGTSPVVTPGTGTASFTITIGSGGTATNGTITLPTAAHGWACHGSDVTTQSSTVFMLKQTASSTTSVTIANFNTAGAQAAWTAGDVLQLSCTGN